MSILKCGLIILIAAIMAMLSLYGIASLLNSIIIEGVICTTVGFLGLSGIIVYLSEEDNIC
jgi:hypothetical protein